MPDRAALIYLYCRASNGDGERPVLQFGGGTAAGDTLSTTDLLGRPYLADEPLIFANACTTSAADPYVANLLEQNLFRRGCRSYIGTETKVPIQFASRFATVFFEFFNRRIDPKPMAVGEALAQTRLFLFSEYANIGVLVSCSATRFLGNGAVFYQEIDGIEFWVSARARRINLLASRFWTGLMF